ncbi:SET domain-containing protein-lysine N-methyltransferase, partial [Candidatus Saccharibacteria bacterium]|nr:SET domain-containing protein-lysine N-methyltransferase [Candidatus Saccharibacteria bacterium]
MEVKESKYGRGVFATRNYIAGEVIEVSPVIELSAEDTAQIDKTLLYDYYFGWGEDGDRAAIALGN